MTDDAAKMEKWTLGRYRFGDDEVWITTDGALHIGIDGSVVVRSLRGWHALALASHGAEPAKGMQARIDELEREQSRLRLQYAGCVGLLAECCVYIPEDMREGVERACLDWAVGTKWGVRRLLDRIDLLPPRSHDPAEPL